MRKKVKKDKTDEELMKIHLADPAEEWLKNEFFKWKNDKDSPYAPTEEKEKR